MGTLPALPDQGTATPGQLEEIPFSSLGLITIPAFKGAQKDEGQDTQKAPVPKSHQQEPGNTSGTESSVIKTNGKAMRISMGKDHCVEWRAG